MTNSEAIKILDNLKPGDYSNPYEKGEAIVMAIYALQAQEANHSTESSLTQKALDTISRQDAIDVLGVFTQADALGHTPKQIVEALPSAEPEIIRCKDCKHFGVDRYNKLTWCSRINYGYGYQADDFCSKAERRTDE